MAPFIDFVGNDSFAADEIRHVMKYAPVDQDALDVDLLYIASFYWDHGHAQVKVPSAAWSADKVIIHIDEGPVFTIGKVAPPADHPELVAIHPGELFSRERIYSDRERLQTYYADRGYAFVDVYPTTEIHADTRTIDLAWRVDKGVRARIGTVTVIGASEDLVRSVLGIAEREWFDEHRLLAGKQALIAKGFDVAVSTKHGAKPDLVDVSIELTRR